MSIVLIELMSNSKIYSFENQFSLENLVGRVVIALAAHPFDLAKILIQLGYEPLPPYPTKTLFGRHRLALPGVFSYLGHIRRTDGYFGLYRGISYKLSTTLINGFVYVNVNEYLKQVYPDVTPTTTSPATELTDKQNMFGIDEQKYKKLLKYLGRETVSRLAALVVSYPFHVMTVRVCAQFVGRETQYDSLFGAVVDIYRTGGIFAFFSGFVPRLSHEILALWISSNVIFVLNSWVDGASPLKSYVSASVNFIVSSLLYPFQLVSTVMCCNGYNARSLAASAYTGPEYSNWIDCWAQLSRLGELKRGSSLLWRYQQNIINAPLYHNPNLQLRDSQLRLKEW